MNEEYDYNIDERDIEMFEYYERVERTKSQAAATAAVLPITVIGESIVLAENFDDDDEDILRGFEDEFNCDEINVTSNESQYTTNDNVKVKIEEDEESHNFQQALVLKEETDPASIWRLKGELSIVRDRLAASERRIEALLLDKAASSVSSKASLSVSMESRRELELKRRIEQLEAELVFKRMDEKQRFERQQRKQQQQQKSINNSSNNKGEGMLKKRRKVIDNNNNELVMMEEAEMEDNFPTFDARLFEDAMLEDYPALLQKLLNHCQSTCINGDERESIIKCLKSILSTSSTNESSSPLLFLLMEICLQLSVIESRFDLDFLEDFIIQHCRVLSEVVLSGGKKLEVLRHFIVTGGPRVAIGLTGITRELIKRRESISVGEDVDEEFWLLLCEQVESIAICNNDQEVGCCESDCLQFILWLLGEDVLLGQLKKDLISSEVVQKERFRLVPMFRCIFAGLEVLSKFSKGLNRKPSVVSNNNNGGNGAALEDVYELSGLIKSDILYHVFMYQQMLEDFNIGDEDEVDDNSLDSGSSLKRSIKLSLGKGALNVLVKMMS